MRMPFWYRMSTLVEAEYVLGMETNGLITELYFSFNFIVNLKTS
jgi:hypothetical protein